MIFGLRRGVLVAALVGSAVLGLATGVGLHRSTPDTESTAGPVTSSSPTTVLAEPGPAFTAKALLQPAELVRYGWVSARVIQSYDDIPTPPITPCTPLADSPGRYRAYAAVYASARTTAAEVVVRFDTVEHAEAAVADLQAAVRSCDTGNQRLRRTVHDEQTVTAASRVDEATWWRTRDAEDDAARGVLGIGRSRDRIVIIHLESDLPGSDPVQTTRIEDLLIQATRRLV